MLFLNIYNLPEYIGFEATYRRKHSELEKNIRIRDKEKRVHICALIYDTYFSFSNSPHSV